MAGQAVARVGTQVNLRPWEEDENLYGIATTFWPRWMKWRQRMLWCVFTIVWKDEKGERHSINVWPRPLANIFRDMRREGRKRWSNMSRLVHIIYKGGMLILQFIVVNREGREKGVTLVDYVALPRHPDHLRVLASGVPDALYVARQWLDMGSIYGFPDVEAYRWLAEGLECEERDLLLVCRAPDTPPGRVTWLMDFREQTRVLVKTLGLRFYYPRRLWGELERAWWVGGRDTSVRELEELLQRG